ncbi:MAG: hypothetical protein KGD59_09195 [Candidatus Heimdallarchaeota archaeon]|nr:hypothetical protein [Candidatus Heimdallarchaeota archaeon]MBY8994709.1 hypothetical protein [Candidatus Heimdallarchaeota archaeon]
MKSQIDQLKSEAEANYSASRWEDSAKTYEHLVGLAQQNNELEQAIEFAIAAIRAWKQITGKEIRINRLYQSIGLIGVKKAAIGFEEQAKIAETNSELKTSALNFEEAGTGYSLIQNYERAKSCFESSAKIFEDLSSRAMSDTDFESAIHMFDRICNLYEKIVIIYDRILIERKELDRAAKHSILEEKEKVKRNIILSRKNKAYSHEKLAQNYLDRDDPDCNRIAEKEFAKAIEILESIDEMKLAKKLQDKKDQIT